MPGRWDYCAWQEPEAEHVAAPSAQGRTKYRPRRYKAEFASMRDLANFGGDMVIDAIQSRLVIIGGISLDKSALVQPEHVAREPRKRRATSPQAASSYGGQPRTFC
jgi:hypothetical protein